MYFKAKVTIAVALCFFIGLSDLITEGRNAGGHLLDCIIVYVTVEIDQISHYELVLP